MPADTIEGSIWVQLLAASLTETSRLYGASIERFGTRGQELVIRLPDGEVRYVRIVRPRQREEVRA